MSEKDDDVLVNTNVKLMLFVGGLMAFCAIVAAGAVWLSIHF
jgi:hypothetical protein